MGQITLTGVDEWTPIGGLLDIVREFPRVEIGILLSFSPECRNRYPSVAWVREGVAALHEKCAVHVCGKLARDTVLDGLFPWLRGAGRVQINGKPRIEELDRALGLFRSVITQYSPANSALLRTPPRPGHAFLVDASGGRGLSPSAWVRPETSRPVGFAGGLGPDNLASELPRIAAAAKGGWWVDMETKIRDTADRFDLCAARACAQIFEEYCLSVLEVS